LPVNHPPNPTSAVRAYIQKLTLTGVQPILIRPSVNTDKIRKHKEAKVRRRLTLLNVVATNRGVGAVATC
jgi:hypothetical protein